jgi:N-terminal domain of galactosyltransferase
MMSTRRLLGAAVRDLPLYVRTLANGSTAYLGIRNRAECITAAPFAGHGFRCEWRWTSDLYAPKIFPLLGRLLFQRALADRPIELAGSPGNTDSSPDVSFVIGHRGRERSPLLDLTLMSIAAQRGVSVEAVVVEQAIGESDLSLPSWVRHVVTPAEDAPFNRAWAFNVGAKVAEGKVVILHDGDMLVPREYAQCVIDRVEAGNEVVDAKRFIFYLSEGDTNAVCRSRRLDDVVPMKIVQNLLAGGSVATTAGAYARLGGMDEGFVGWGGEDSEFWERCALLPRWDFGYLPIVHLWHREQPMKEQTDNPTVNRYSRLAGLPPDERVRRLAAAPRGGAVPRVEDPFADVIRG